jgi:uncharacterized protein YjaG (DUF416 family)
MKRYKIEQDGFSCIVRSLEELLEEVIPELDSHSCFEVYEEINSGWKLVRMLSVAG